MELLFLFQNWRSLLIDSTTSFSSIITSILPFLTFLKSLYYILVCLFICLVSFMALAGVWRLKRRGSGT